MEDEMDDSVTLADVAKAAHVAKSTASLALRGSRQVSEETSRRVNDAAKRLGYRADSRVGALMTRLRHGRPLRERETLAFVWVSVTRESTKASKLLRMMRESAGLRAEQLGCKMDDFWLNQDGMTPKRLEGVLRARGIAGIVFSTPIMDLSVRIDWNWTHFASVIMGNSDWEPALNRVGHHHYKSMWTAMEKLRQLGRERPAVILNRSHHLRIHGVHQGAFLANHPQPESALSMSRFGLPDNLEELRPWLDAIRPDALIFVSRPCDPVLAELRKLYPIETMVTLNNPDASLPGMDMREDLIAASAVDMVLSQFHNNLRGIPTHPATLLLEGEWREK